MLNIEQTNLRRPAGRVFLSVFLIGHFAGAFAWWWLSPKGFPWWHSRFWLNSVLPWTVISIAAVGVYALAKRRPLWAGNILLMFSTAWLSGSLTGGVLFPTSLQGLWQLGLLIACGGLACSWLPLRCQTVNLWSRFLLTLLCLLSGWFSIWAQLPDLASTRPANIAPPDSGSLPSSDSDRMLKLGSGSRFAPQQAGLLLSGGSVQIQCYPLLQFDRISPDGFWSLLAPRNKNRRAILAKHELAPGDHLYSYSDNSLVRLVHGNTDCTIECDAWTRVGTDTYAHLNSYCVLVLSGHKELALEFSSCPGKKIEVLPADYPTGRPARFAYMASTGELHVVEATSGEKGPFHQLAIGRLRRGETLGISFYDSKQQVATLTLEDWTEQLSTELSPTAGWGVPQNAIEFRRVGESKRSAVEIHITLAATSVGRGFETVGHVAGVYRNRLRFLPTHHNTD